MAPNRAGNRIQNSGMQGRYSFELPIPLRMHLSCAIASPCRTIVSLRHEKVGRIEYPFVKLTIELGFGTSNAARFDL